MKSEVYNSDCLAAMRLMPGNAFDLCLTDPPFGVRADAWDDMDEYEFARFSMAWLSEIHRISKAAIIFCTEGNQIESLVKMLYPRIRKAIWHKPMGSQYAGASEARMWFGYEVILHCYEGATQPKELIFATLLKQAREKAGLSRGAVDMAIRGTKTGLCYRWEEAACIPTPDQIRKLRELFNLNGEFDAAIVEATDNTCETACVSDVFTHRTVTHGIHPCQKPLKLLTEILETMGANRKTVIDPFVGSGSSRIAACDLGFDFTGYELDKNYFEAQEKRFADHIAQPKLFTPTPIIETQGSMFGECS